MNLSEAQKIIAVLKAAYPQWRPEEGSTDRVWHEMLSDLPYAVVSEGTARWIKTTTGTWPPTIGQLRAFLCEMLPEQLPTPDEAWAAVVSRAGSVGRLGSPGEDLPGEIAKLVGWQRICNADPNDPALRAHFREIYRFHLDRAKTESRLQIGLEIERSQQARLEKPEQTPAIEAGWELGGRR